MNININININDISKDPLLSQKETHIWETQSLPYYSLEGFRTTAWRSQENVSIQTL